MSKEANFLNNSFFKESKFGFQIDIAPEDIKLLKLRNGKYRIEAKRPRNNPDKWYLAENTWEPQGGFKPKETPSLGSDLPQSGDVWTKARNWQSSAPVVDDKDLPF